MFNDNEPPVSLFSFQDIITSLTGIMIFFLLLLSLYIMELTQKNQEGSPLYKELAQIKEQNRVLKTQISEITSDIKNYRKRIQSAQKKDESTLMAERFRFENLIRTLKARKNDLNGKITKGKEELSRSEKENAKLKRQRQELVKEQKKCAELAQEAEQQKEKISKIRNEIKKRKKEIQVTVDSSIDKIPVLIECSIDRISIVNTRNKVRRVIQRQSPVTSDLIANAIECLRVFPPSQYYYVLMVKPSAADYITFFQRSLFEAFKSSDIGIEPILEHEGVANE